MTSEKVYNRRGYKFVTAYCLLRKLVLSAQASSRSEMGVGRGVDFEVLDRLSFALIGSLSPPRRPSQSARKTGASEAAVTGSM
jgi:hypothetical protein